MQYKVIKLFIFFTLIASQLNARTENKVTGKVVESKTGEVLAYATVTIQSPDKKVLGGTYTATDGKFAIQNIEEGDKVVKVSFIGYKDTTFTTKVAYSGASCDLGTISLLPNATQLNAAVVSSRVPVIEQKLDKLVMNVSEAVHTQGSNALDVLRKAPGLSIDPSGNILLNGQAVQIWIDNRPSNLTGEDLTTLLNSTDGSTIDKIEIMAHPSSKYDASGSGGIINIKTKKIFLKGLSGNTRLAYDAGPYDALYNGVNATLNVNYRTEKNNLFINYSPRYFDSFYNFKSTTEYGDNILNSETNAKIFQNSHNYKIGNDYYINKNNIFGVILYGAFRNMNDNSYGDTGSKLYENSTLAKKTITNLGDRKKFGNISGNLNYTRIIKEGNELTLNLDYGYFGINNKSWQDNEISNGQGTLYDPVKFNSNSEQYINLLSFKADYEKIIWKSTKLESGLKVARSYTDNDLVRNDFISGNWEVNNELSSKFTYTEIISAAYVSLAKQLNAKFVGKAGIRVENTQSDGDWISSDSKTSKNYTDFFPNVYVGYNPNKNLRLSLSYSLRINRPSYNQLNQFRQYVDAQSSIEGNPDLDPELNHEFTFSAGYKQHLNLVFIFQQSNNKIIQNPYFNETTGEKKLMWENFGMQRFSGLALSLTEYPLTKWFYTNINLFAANFENHGAADYTSNGLFAQGNAGFTFLMPKTWKAEVNCTMQTGIPYGYFKVLPQGQVSVALKKSFMKNKADFALTINDLFDSQHERIRINDYSVSSYSLNQRTKTRTIGISFNYKFGQGKAARQRKVGVQDEAGRVSTQ